MNDATIVIDPAPAEPAATPAPAAPVEPTPAPAAADPAPAPSAEVTDFRDRIANGDEKVRRDLERFTDERALYKSLKETQSKLNDPFRVRIPDEKSTDEERAAFAKLQGVPEDPSNYDIQMDEGYSLADSDKEILDPYIEQFHAEGGVLAHPKVINAVSNAYAKIQEDMAARQLAVAEEKTRETQSLLKEEWGSDHKANLGYASGAVEKYFGETDFLRMPLQDGTLIGSHPVIVKALAAIGRETLEDHVFLEAGKNGGDARETLQSEKAQIMKLYADGDMKAYGAKQDRLNEINTALAKHANG